MCSHLLVPASSQADANGAAQNGAPVPAAPAGGARGGGGGNAARDASDDDGGSASDDGEEYQEIEAPAAPKGRKKDAPAAKGTKEGKKSGAAAEAAPLPADAAGLSDADYLKSRVRANFSDSDDDDDDVAAEAEEAAESESDSDDDDEDVDAAAEDDDADAEAGAADGDARHRGLDADGSALLSSTGRLFLRNLPYTATEEELREAFAPYGDVAAVHVLVDKGSGRSKGLAYVQYTVPAEAQAALAALDGSFFQGRLLHLLPAAPAPNAAVEPGKDADSDKATAFKAEKEARLRAGAGDARAWSTLYMRPDTVAAALAARYGVDRADVMEPGASGAAAVRLALGEAQLVADTKRELASAGVDIAALEAAARGGGGSAAAGLGGASAVRRSGTVLLLKNLPFEADADELRALAARFGGVARLLLPASRALCVVEFLEAADARRAFGGLAFKRYRHVPIYVEWAPADLLPPPDAAAKPAAEAARRAAAKPAPVSAADAAGAGAAGDDGDGDGGGCTLFVKNLAFSTDDAALRKHFEAQAALRGKVRAARVTRKPGRTPGSTLSAGFGFVELATSAAAAAALAALDGSALDGHCIKLQLSRAAGVRAPTKDDGDAAGGAGGAAEQPAGASGTKLVVRNVAFEATREDLRALFRPFGSVASLRLPRKFDGQHRGFAFVELATRAEARAAFEAVGGTHLYGRHLVTEWAAPDEGVDALRKRTADRFAAAEGDAGAKRAKKMKPRV